MARVDKPLGGHVGGERVRAGVEDTRRFETHAEWCTHLSARGMLSPDHRPCLYLGGECIVTATEGVRASRRAARAERLNR